MLNLAPNFAALGMVLMVALLLRARGPVPLFARQLLALAAWVQVAVAGLQILVWWRTRA